MSETPVADRIQLNALRVAGVDFAHWRDVAHRLQTLRLGGDAPLRVGRELGCDILLPTTITSKRQAVLRPSANGGWWVRDTDSRNGTFLAGIGPDDDESALAGATFTAVTGDGCRIAPGHAVIRVGHGGPAVHVETAEPADLTQPEEPASAPVWAALTRRQREVLTALCHPLFSSPYASPADNATLAATLSLQPEGVRSALRVLRERYGATTREQLAARAMEEGIKERATHRG